MYQRANIITGNRRDILYVLRLARENQFAIVNGNGRLCTDFLRRILRWNKRFARLHIHNGEIRPGIGVVEFLHQVVGNVYLGLFPVAFVPSNGPCFHHVGAKEKCATVLSACFNEGRTVDIFQKLNVKYFMA